MLNWTRHYSSLSNTHIHNLSLLSSSTHSSLVLLPPQFNFFLLSAFVFTWVERKGRVKECDPDTPSSACSDRQANIPPADSWHAIVTCWILFQTVRPLVECLAFMSTCECVYVCVTVGLFHVTVFGICSKHAPFLKNKQTGIIVKKLFLCYTNTHASPRCLASALFSVRGVTSSD